MNSSRTVLPRYHLLWATPPPVNAHHQQLHSLSNLSVRLLQRIGESCAMIRNGLTHIITYYDTKGRISGIVTVGPRMCHWEKRKRNERPHPPPKARRQSFPSILVWSNKECATITSDGELGGHGRSADGCEETKVWEIECWTSSNPNPILLLRQIKEMTSNLPIFHQFIWHPTIK